MCPALFKCDVLSIYPHIFIYFNNSGQVFHFSKGEGGFSMIPSNSLCVRNLNRAQERSPVTDPY